MTRIVSVRETFDQKVLWVCVRCRASVKEHTQPRCPNCHRLMRKAT